MPRTAEPFATTAESYAAARSGAIVVDRAAWKRMTFAGAGAAAVLNGLLSNEIASLAAGQVRFAAALTPKGKVLADVHVVMRPTDVLVISTPATWDAWSTMIRKYVNPRLARWTDVSAHTASVGIYGPRAVAVVATILPGSRDVVAGLEPLSSAVVTTPDGDVTIARLAHAPAPGFDLVFAAEQRDGVWRAAVAAGACPADAASLDALRVEAGVPAHGVDMDEHTLPQEVHLDTLGAISFDKGCYTGQETVARLHFRGHVNRSLRGLRASHALARAAELVDAQGNVVGDVRSVAMSPRLGAIALAMVRREVADGAELTVRGADAPTATVVSLPFP